jgi:hypothetical protein
MKYHMRGIPGRFRFALPLLLTAVLGFLSNRDVMGAASVEDGLEVNSYTLPLRGNKIVVTVNATPAELSKFISGGSTIVFRDGEMGPSVPAEGDEEVGPGGSFPFLYKKVVVIPGRFIFVRLDESSVYMMRDYPVRNLSKWDLSPIPDGSQMTFCHYQEMEEIWWAPLVKPFVPPEYWYRSQDIMLAEIQAHFDPSEDPEELLKFGNRGELFSSVLQVNEVSTLLPASPQEVQHYLNHPDRPYLQVGEAADDCLTRPLPLDRTMRCTTTLEQGGREIVVNTFGIDHVCGKYVTNMCMKLDMTTRTTPSRKGRFLRTYYQVAMGMVGYLEMMVEPEGEDTRLTVTWKWEMPEAVSFDAIDQMLFLSAVPEMTKQTVLEIKKGVESKKR